MAAEAGLEAHAVVRTWLQDRDCRLWPWIDVGELERLVAALGSGADLLEGEEPLAIMLHDGPDRGGCLGTLAMIDNVLNPITWIVRSAMPRRVNWNYGALVTDRRIVIRDWLEAVEAEYAAIHEPTCTGGILSFFGIDFLNFTVGDTRHRLTVPGHRGLRRFLEVASDEARAGRIREQRVAAPEAEAGDPSGAVSFLGRIRVEDPRAAALLEVVSTRVASGRLSPTDGLDLARRVALLHRTTVAARGSRDGLWISPLRPQELDAFFESRLGRPQPEGEVDGLPSVRFVRDREWTKAAVGTLLLLGQGMLVLPRQDLLVSVVERSHPTAGTWTGYRIRISKVGGWEPLSEWESHTLCELHKALLAFEAQVLLRRAVLGTELDPVALLQADQAAVDAALVADAPRADPKLFRSTRSFASIHKKVDPLPPRSGLARELIPGHLKPPPSLRVPGAVTAVAMTNVIAGMTTMVLFSTLYCFGGVSVLDAIKVHLLSRVPNLNEEATTGVFMLGLLGQWGALLVLGPIRAVLGGVMLLMPGATRAFGVLSALLAVIGVCAADLPGLLAGVATVVLLTRPSVRDYLG